MLSDRVLDLLQNDESIYSTTLRLPQKCLHEHFLHEVQRCRVVEFVLVTWCFSLYKQVQPRLRSAGSFVPISLSNDGDTVRRPVTAFGIVLLLCQLGLSLKLLYCFYISFLKI